MTETTNFIILGIFLSIVLGLIFGYFLILIKKRSLVKNAIKKIEKQKMKYRIGGRKIDILTGEMEKKPKEEAAPLPAKPTKIPKPTKIKSVPPRHKPKTKKKTKKRR